MFVRAEGGRAVKHTVKLEISTQKGMFKIDKVSQKFDIENDAPGYEMLMKIANYIVENIALEPGD